MKLPPLRDARWLQACVLCGYAVVAREVFHFERSHWVLLGCVAIAVSLDLLLGRIVFRHLLFPLSPLIIGLASSLLLDSRHLWTYFLAAALAVLSKALVTYKGRHLFNPANLGVSLVLLLLPRYATGMPSLFSGYLWPSIVFACLGIATVLYARQWVASFSWIAAFLFFALVRSRIAGAPFIAAAAPATGPAFLLFSFHMISDPATSPRLTGTRLGFTFTVAAIDAALRMLQIPYGSFYALFIVCAFNPWIRDWEARRAEPQASILPAVPA